MATLATATVAAVLLVPPAALAKLPITIRAADTTPAVGRPVAVTLRAGEKLDWNLRLIAVAPGANIFRTVATITGDTRRPDPAVARHGFEIPVHRQAADRWRATVTFPRPGRWRVVVPNVAPEGVLLPAGAARLALDVG